MKKKRSIKEENSMDLAERAFYLLRRIPLSSWIFYYAGAVPFIGTLLFFLSDMSISPFAADHCAGSALGLAGLFLWMRTGQSLFGQSLLARLAHRNPDPISARLLGRQFQLHARYSSWGLLLVPLSALTAVPYPWVFAYFNNLCLTDLNQHTVTGAAAEARAKSIPWPKQNHLLISMISLVGLIVLLNIFSALMQAPALLKSLAGIETVFAQSRHWLGSITCISVLGGLTYLIMDPWVKAIYALRFHAAESICSGADLLAEVKKLPRRNKTGSRLAGLLALLLLAAPAVRAQTPANPPAIETGALERAIERVSQQPEFTWRMPRDFSRDTEPNPNFFSRFIDSVSDWLTDMARSCKEQFKRFIDWLEQKFGTDDQDRADPNEIDPGVIKALSIGLLSILALVLGGYLIKLLISRRRAGPAIEPIRPVVVTGDMLEDESIMATLLAEDEWIALARELGETGELRKALRAWFLAGLACLSRTELLIIKPAKSNREYSHELHRRSRRCPEVTAPFAANIQIFERAWYGQHPVTFIELEAMEENIERMRHVVDA